MASSFSSFNRVCRFTSRPLPSTMTSKRDESTIVLEYVGEGCAKIHRAGSYRFIRGISRARKMAGAEAIRAGARIIEIGEDN